MPKHLLPILMAQGLWVGWKALKLPEAAGAREGRIGSGPPLRLAVIGDSSAAGVGVACQDQALLGQLLSCLQDRYTVDFQLLATTGHRTRDGLGRLDQVRDCDVAVTVFGVNDITKGTSAKDWSTDQATLMDRLTAEKGARQVIVSPIPPIGNFPLLPNPLRRVAADRAALFQTLQDDLIAARPQAVGLRFDLPMDPALMAPDGYHPGPQVYRFWAETVAGLIR